MGIFEILSLVYILFIILWAFKLVIDSLVDELLKFYRQRIEENDD